MKWERQVINEAIRQRNIFKKNTVITLKLIQQVFAFVH